MNVNFVILKLLTALVRMALEHDKGYMSRDTRNKVFDTLKEADAILLSDRT